MLCASPCSHSSPVHDALCRAHAACHARFISHFAALTRCVCLLASAQLASSASGELAVSSSSLTVIDPEVPSRTRAASRGISRSASRVPSPTRAGRRSVVAHDDWRTNRFQLAPERISALLAEEAERQSRSGYTSPMPGSRRSMPILPDDDDMSDDFQYGEEASNADGFRRILRHDAAYIMRRRAEQGYGLDNVSGPCGWWTLWFVILVLTTRFSSTLPLRPVSPAANGSRVSGSSSTVSCAQPSFPSV